MEKLGILVVDDEEEVRESILKNMHWAELGYEVLGSAQNGEDAYALVEALEPDIVLTDIRMPYMDGLVLAEKMQQKYPFIKVVLLTGFDEFEYAKKAIQLNIMEYILKPINIEELSELLTKLRNRIIEEKKEKRNISILKEKYTKSLPLIHERIITDLLKGNLGEDEARIREMLVRYEIKIESGKLLVAVTMSVEPINGNSEFYHSMEYIYISLIQILNEDLEDMVVETIRTSAGFTALMTLDQDKKGDEMVRFLNRLQIYTKNVKKVFDVLVTVGVGGCVLSLGEISQSYNDSKEALGYSQIIGKGNVIYIRDVESVHSDPFRINNKLENDLLTSIKFSTPEQIEACVDRMLEDINERRLHNNQIQMSYLYLFNLFIGQMQKFGLDINLILPKGKSIGEQIQKLDTSDGARTTFVYMAKKIHQYINWNREDDTKRLIERAKDYIDKNYHNPDLSGEMVCETLHISPSYFSTIFKKEMQESYVSYLTNLRLKKASELLMQTDEKAYVIALRVGYPEPNYFSYVFKKKFGVAPSKYRESKRNV